LREGEEGIFMIDTLAGALIEQRNFSQSVNLDLAARLI
jgi:hypothetical protein